MLAVVSFFLLAACSSQKEVIQKPVFFPPPPDEPRLQFLTGFEDSSIFEEQKSTFSLILSGTEKLEADVRIFKPLGIAVYKGVVYVCDTYQGTVLVIDPAKYKFERLRGSSGSGTLKKPLNLTVSDDGTLFVADVFRKEVLTYTAEGDFIRAFGKDILKKPVGVAADRENIYVLDNADSIIKVLDRSSGALLREIGSGTTAEDTLWRPFAITRDTKGYLYVTNTGTCKVIKYDADGHALLSFGNLGDAFGDFTRPRGVAVDQEGRIFVVDASFQNVQIFNEQTRLLLPFGMPGLPRGSMNLPAGIAISSDRIDYFLKFADPSFDVEQLVFITNQDGKDKVAVYGLGRLRSAPGAKSSASGGTAGSAAK